MKYIENLIAERDSLASQVMALADKAGNEERSLTDAETTSVNSWRERITALDNEVRSWNSTAESFSKFQSIAQQGTEKRAQEKADNERRTMGQAFAESAEFRNYQLVGASGRFGFETRAAITTDTPPGSAFMDKFRGYTLPVPTAATPLLDAIGSVQVSQNVVEYPVYPAAAPSAAVVAEGALKPEAVLTATTATQTLQTIAHHVVATRQALQDSAQLRDWIDGNLTRGVDDKLESLAATAITGATFPTATGADLLSAIRVGVGKVGAAGFTATGVLINPEDLAAIDLQVMATAGTAPVGVNTLWGLQVIPANAVPIGSAFVGNWKQAAVLFYRTNTEVFVSDSHADLFLKNQFVILAERRALAAVTQPSAAVEVSATP